MTIRSGRKKFRYRYIPNEIKSKLTIKTDLKTYIQLGLLFMMYYMIGMNCYKIHNEYIECFLGLTLAMMWLNRF